MSRWEHHLSGLAKRHPTGRAAEVVSRVREVWERLRESAPDLPPPDRARPLDGDRSAGAEWTWYDRDQRSALAMEITEWASEWRDDGRSRGWFARRCVCLVDRVEYESGSSEGVATWGGRVSSAWCVPSVIRLRLVLRPEVLDA